MLLKDSVREKTMINYLGKQLPQMLEYALTNFDADICLCAVHARAAPSQSLTRDGLQNPDTPKKPSVANALVVLHSTNCESGTVLALVFDDWIVPRCSAQRHLNRKVRCTALSVRCTSVR